MGLMDFIRGELIEILEFNDDSRDTISWRFPDSDREIKRGADDESEMGVFHDLFQPQREANLRARLEEYTPAGIDAGVIFVT